MFAKLMKKIQEEGGTVNDPEKGFSSPAHGVSPSSISKVHGQNTPLSSPVFKDLSPKDTDSGISSLASVNSFSCEDISLKDGSASKEEVLSLLLRRSDQCKKLEAKISEYTILLKEKNKTVEKLEAAIEKEQNATAKGLQELDAQHQAYRARLTAEIEQEKKEVEQKLQEAERLKEKFYKQEVENDEFQGLATQELAKVKHLLLNAEADLLKYKEDLEERNSQLDHAQKNLKELENQVKYLQEQTVELTKQNNIFKEECAARAQAVESLTDDKSAFERRVTELTKNLTAESSGLAALQIRYADLENEHQILLRNSELHKNKTGKSLSEKDDCIGQLQERISTLEQRIQDHGLSEDERVMALEAERDSLEERLSETRQQLMEVKSIWSDKITHLEEQITHLNAKIVEDNEELERSILAREAIKEQYLKQIEQLMEKLDDAENRAAENWNLAKHNGVYCEKQREIHEAEVKEMKLEKSDLEVKYKAEINEALVQLSALETRRETETKTAEQRITHLETQKDNLLQKEQLMEKRLGLLEEERTTLKTEIDSKETKCTSLEKEIEEKKIILQNLDMKVHSLEEEFSKTNSKLDSTQKTLSLKQTELEDCIVEMDKLLLRNAELSQQVQSVQQFALEEKGDLQEELKEKTDTVNGLQEEKDQLMYTVTGCREKLEMLETRQEEMDEVVAEVDRLRKTVSLLEDQLDEKNMTLKNQQQKLTDLRKTLQRELKVQALPNDELPVSKESAHTPPTRRKAAESIGQSGLPPHLPKFSSSLFLKDFSLPTRGPYSLPVMADDKFRVKVDDKDVNFEYLKHVVLKFMLSREHEAIQLIRAISVLLKFTPEEQQLIRETLEYKMSWFGARPSLGRGQTAKIIPPSF